MSTTTNKTHCPESKCKYNQTQITNLDLSGPIDKGQTRQSNYGLQEKRSILRLRLSQNEKGTFKYKMRMKKL